MSRYKPKTDRRNGNHKPQAVPAKFRVGFLATLDGRTDLAKALRSTYESVVQDVGGQPDVSRVKQSLIERFCWLEAILQTLENEMANGVTDKAEVLSKWIQAVNSLSGLAKTLGIERKTRTVDLTTYLQRGALTGNGHADGAGGVEDGK